MVTWREQLAFAPLDMGERSEEIARRLRHAIELGVLEDGFQLPSESELSTLMGVSTITLRAGLAQLRHWGLLVTRRGHGGGSFVRANPEHFTEAQRTALATYSLDDLRDIREYRAFLAGSAAAAAAERRQLIPLKRLASLGEAIRVARKPTDLARADSRFHMEVAAAARSVRLTREEMAMQAEVGVLIWAHSQTETASLNAANEHAAIVAAIADGDARLARALAEDHVRTEMNRLIDLRISKGVGQAAADMDDAATDRAISGVKVLAANLGKTAAAAIQLIEEAALSALGESEPGRSEQLQGVYAVARTGLIQAFPDISALGFITDPSFFGEAEVIGCSASSGLESVQRLTVDWTDYDFATAPWWPADPAEEGLVQATGAFVDASGSNEYIVTFSKGVWRNGRMVGVASADVLVKQLQEDFEPLLLALPAGACILDQNGVVIATNAGSLLGATLQNLPQQGGQFALPGVPWQLCFEDPHEVLKAPQSAPQLVK
ncbi:GntR family transcriptional regulator [Paenarthrobacter nitroguajacolicus]|uniref:GntR family transcriptional regulator n=1 Tax=Paenarthrobacter nitroguajacolicus TaxID=211146 RepID=UPI001AE27FEC|nr:FCD domain-containing protein [Paenarthrobacter nitroguajacolicus]MDR6639433.1 DNA-binding FadR family transcriptional regulator [Paenarthrobacter nitroguajacolicus]